MKIFDKIILYILIMIVGVMLGYWWRIYHENFIIEDIYKMQRSNACEIKNLELKLLILEQRVANVKKR